MLTNGSGSSVTVGRGMLLGSEGQPFEVVVAAKLSAQPISDRCREERTDSCRVCLRQCEGRSCSC